MIMIGECPPSTDQRIGYWWYGGWLDKWVPVVWIHRGIRERKYRPTRIAHHMVDCLKLLQCHPDLSRSSLHLES